MFGPSVDVTTHGGSESHAAKRSFATGRLGSATRLRTPPVLSASGGSPIGHERTARVVFRAPKSGHWSSTVEGDLT